MDSALAFGRTFPIVRRSGAGADESRWSNLGAVAAAAVATVFASIGDPSLRHDWSPFVPGLRLSLETVTGWNPVGLGAPVGYPASFLIVPSLATLAALSSPYIAHVILMLGIALVTAFGARRLAARTGTAATAQVAASFFALFNPWVYTKLVAGHEFMLLAYGATYWLVAECLARHASVRVLAVSAILIAPQIQFVVLDAVIFVFLAVRTREYRPLAVVAASLLPVAVGIWAGRSSLVGIPITAEWEIGQSVDPFAGTLLRGYFTLYDTKLDPFLAPALWVIAALAAIGGLEILLRGHRARWILAGTTATLLISFGLRGPLAWPFDFAIQHVAEIGLFRELYDLLGYAAIGYCALCCASTQMLRFASPLFACASLALAASWFGYPPSRYWVDARSLSRIVAPSAAHTRFALIPAVAPVKFGERGSGVDPDVHPYQNDIVPLNEPNPQFPISSAVGEYLRSGATRQLGALSVREVVARPWLQTDVASLAGQLAFLPNASTFGPRKSVVAQGFVPELTLSPPPQVGSLDSIQGAGNVFFADAARAALEWKEVPVEWARYHTVSTIHAPNRFVHASEGWVDARFGFLEQPWLGQAFGGALTTRADALLELEGGTDALVWVRGRLLGRTGETLSGTTGGYRWVRVPQRIRAVRCEGECVVAAQGRVPPKVPLEPDAQTFAQLPFRRLTPWLVFTNVPAGGPRLLRYNVRYDGRWSAYDGTSRLPHVRVDTAVNGWLLSKREQSSRLTIIQTGAACVALSESIALLLLITVLLSFLRRSRTCRPAA